MNLDVKIIRNLLETLPTRMREMEDLHISMLRIDLAHEGAHATMETFAFQGSNERQGLSLVLDFLGTIYEGLERKSSEGVATVVLRDPVTREKVELSDTQGLGPEEWLYPIIVGVGIVYRGSLGDFEELLEALEAKEDQHDS